jgi:hypothetical protein
MPSKIPLPIIHPSGRYSNQATGHLPRHVCSNASRTQAPSLGRFFDQGPNVLPVPASSPWPQLDRLGEFATFHSPPPSCFTNGYELEDCREPYQSILVKFVIHVYPLYVGVPRRCPSGFSKPDLPVSLHSELSDSIQGLSRPSRMAWLRGSPAVVTRGRRPPLLDDLRDPVIRFSEILFLDESV